MIRLADLIGLTPEQADKARDIDAEVRQSREAIEVWHRLLDRRRSDRVQGLHPISEISLAETKISGEQGRMVRHDPEEPTAESVAREPFYVNSEHTARALLMHSVGYLTNAAGEKLAFDKGVGDKDKMAEWIIREISLGAIAYIRKHRPCIFGIPIAVADS